MNFREIGDLWKTSHIVITNFLDECIVIEWISHHRCRSRSNVTAIRKIDIVTIDYDYAHCIKTLSAYITSTGCNRFHLVHTMGDQIRGILMNRYFRSQRRFERLGGI